jgi:hypothetical protein
VNRSPTGAFEVLSTPRPLIKWLCAGR